MTDVVFQPARQLLWKEAIELDSPWTPETCAARINARNHQHSTASGSIIYARALPHPTTDAGYQFSVLLAESWVTGTLMPDGEGGTHISGEIGVEARVAWQYLVALAPIVLWILLPTWWILLIGLVIATAGVVTTTASVRDQKRILRNLLDDSLNSD
jgi:hypothetical protein